MYSKLLASAAVLALISGTGLAQEQATEVAAEQAAPAEGILQAQSEDQMLTEDIIGADVRNAEDESIGEINSLVLDGDMKVVGALIGVGGFLGIGEKIVGVGWGDLTPAEDGFTVQISKEQLENAEPYLTLARQQAEAEAEAAQQQMMQNQQQPVPEPVVPEPAPAAN